MVTGSKCRPKGFNIAWSHARPCSPGPRHRRALKAQFLQQPGKQHRGVMVPDGFLNAVTSGPCLKIFDQVQATCEDTHSADQVGGVVPITVTLADGHCHQIKLTSRRWASVSPSM